MMALVGDSRPVIRKSPEQLRKMREAGKLLREVFGLVEERIAPGALDSDLDRTAAQAIEKMGATSAFLGYKGFPKTICCSLNEEVVHGIPNGRILKEGDIVGIDIGLAYEGFYADSATTYAVGAVSDEARRLMDVTREALQRGIEKMWPNNRVGDVSQAIQDHAESHGFGVVREYTGHGIGRAMHEAPECPNFLDPQRGRGKRLMPGVTIAIEPMINEGTYETRVLDDKWTVVTEDGRLSAHFEHTVAVTEDGPEILTL